MDEPTYALQLMRPFLRVLRETPGFPTEVIDQLEATDPATRFALATAQELFRGAIELTGDQDLGLRAARAGDLGEYEVVEYAAGSAPDWRSALEVVFRYCRLMNEAADFRLEQRDGRAYIVLDSTVPLTRQAKDFQVAALFVAAQHWLAPAADVVEVWFSHPEPDSLEGYRETFGQHRVQFGRPWDGFVFDAALLDTPMPRADPSLHRLLRQHAERLLAELEPGDGLIERVRADIVATLGDGSVGVEATAEHLHMSRRTLARRLREQATSFSDLLEDARHRMATRYLETTQHTVEEIAFLLGYSSSAPFVRAFRRWADSSPLEYRRRHRVR